MDPVTATFVVSAAEAKAASTSILEGAEAAAEVKEAIIGEQGLIEQVDIIRYSSIESVAARNETLLLCRNAELGGRVHPETGIPFVKETVLRPDGSLYEGVFPEFNSTFETHLPSNLLIASDFEQSQYCNTQLGEAVMSDPELKAKYNDTQVQQIYESDTPDGFTWHHHQETGKMQLVDSQIHLKTGHTGGKVIWGGGSSWR